MSIKDFFVFIKLRISAPVAISSAVGYILSSRFIDVDIFILLVGIFLLASGSGALNQVQEWSLDALMNRTRNRPIPRRIISPFKGLVISLFLISMGLLFLSQCQNFYLVITLSLLAVVIYNGVYTPLKRVSPLAALPGALIGAIPPMIGWVFTGNSPLHPLNIALASFFFIWQIPHFWLLLILHEDDYRRAGFPVLTDIISPLQLSRISFIWIVALVGCSFLIISMLEHLSWLTFGGVVVLGIYLIFRTHKMVRVVQPRGFYRFAFINLNFFVLCVSLILSFNKLFNL